MDWVAQMKNKSKRRYIMKNILTKIGLSVVVSATFLSSTLNAGNHAYVGGNQSPAFKNAYSSTTDKNVLLKYKKQIQQYETLVVMYQSQFESYKSNLKNRKTLLPKQWKLFAKSVTNLSKAIEFSEGMNLAASSYELEFKKEFPSYHNQNIEKQYKQLRLTARDNIKKSLKHLGLEVQNMQDEEAILKQLEIFAKTSTTQKSVIAVANQLALNQIDILSELQKTINVQEQIQSAFLSVK